MEYLWVYVTVVAAALQCARIALQRQVAMRHGTFVATAARYLLGAPIVGALVVVLLLGGWSLPPVTSSFASDVAVAGLSQILASFLLLRCLQMRSFAVGATLSRTEALQIALLTPFLLDETLSAMTLTGVMVSVVGIFALSMQRSAGSRRSFLAELDAPSILMGLGAGFFFAISSIFVRKASVELGDTPFMIRSITTLFAVTWLQAAIALPFLTGRYGRRFVRLLREPKLSIALAVTSAGGSMGWYVALALMTAARVQVVGQIGIVFIVLTSWLYFREKPTLVELAGITLVVAGIVTVIING